MLRSAIENIKDIFKVCAVGTAVGVMASCVGIKPVSNANSLDFDSPHDVTLNENLLPSVLRQHNQPYDYNEHDYADLPGGQHTIAIQLESSHQAVSAINPQGVRSRSALYGRHGEAASSIVRENSARISRRDIDVFFVEAPSAGSWDSNMNIEETLALFDVADVITFSMAYVKAGDQAYSYSPGMIDTPAEIRAADAFWASHDAIFMQSAGNNGILVHASDLERQPAELRARADTMLIVGEARLDSAGNYRVEAHSGRQGTSLVAPNPFFEGFSYPYIRSEAELRRDIEVYFGMRPSGEARTNEEIFRAALESPEQNAATNVLIDAFGYIFGTNSVLQISLPSVSLQSCHPDFANADFKGKDILLRDPGWQRENPDAVLEAFKEGLVAARDYHLARNKADENDMIAELSGTSFSQPYAGAMVAAQHELHPELPEGIIVAGALLAAEPVDKLESIVGEHSLIQYTNNGRHLPYDNAGNAGFGLLEERAYMAVMNQMAELLDARPDLSTEQVVQRTYATFSPVNNNAAPIVVPPQDSEEAGGLEETAPITMEFVFVDAAEPAPAVVYRDYAVPVSTDMVVCRTNLALQFRQGTGVAPEEIFLISPSGGEIRMSCSRILGSNPRSYSLASTDGHLGNYTQGTWTLRIPDTVQLESAELCFVGGERDGLLDTYMTNHTDNSAFAAVSSRSLENLIRPAAAVPVSVQNGMVDLRPVSPDVALFDYSLDLFTIPLSGPDPWDPLDPFWPLNNNPLYFSPGTHPEGRDDYLFNILLDLDRYEQHQKTSLGASHESLKPS